MHGTNSTFSHGNPQILLNPKWICHAVILKFCRTALTEKLCPLKSRIDSGYLAMQQEIVIVIAD